MSDDTGEDNKLPEINSRGSRREIDPNLNHSVSNNSDRKSERVTLKE